MLRLDIWAELNLIGNVQPSEFDAMSDEVAHAHLQALKRVIERARAEREEEDRKRQWEREQRELAQNFERMCDILNRCSSYLEGVTQA